MRSRVYLWFKRWFVQAGEIKRLTQHVVALQAQFKYLQQRLDRQEVPR